MLDAIRSARVSIRLETYIYTDGRLGREFLAELLAAAQRGVRVRVLVDAFGSWLLPDDFFAPLEAAGAAAGNVGRVEPAIHEKLIQLARDSSRDVRLQVVIAAKKIAGIDPITVLLNAQLYSYRDPLIPHIVWQNLHPLLEENQAEIARRLDQFKGRETGFSFLLPR